MSILREILRINEDVSNIERPEIAAGSGITGSGVPPQLAYFTGSTTIGSTTEFSYTANLLAVADGATIGQAAGPLLTFDDTNNYLGIMGCDVGNGTLTPAAPYHIYRSGANAKITLERAGDATTIVTSTAVKGAIGTTTDDKFQLLVNNLSVFEIEDSSGAYIAHLPFDGQALTWGVGEDGQISVSGDDLYIKNVTTDQDILINVAPGGVDTNALFVQGSTGYIGVNTTIPLDQLQISGTSPAFRFQDTNAGVDEKNWRLRVTNTIFRLQLRDDADTTNVSFLEFTRSGMTPVETRNYGNFTLPVDGDKIIVGAGADGEMYSSGDDLYIKNVTTDQDIYINIAPGGVDTNAVFVQGTTGFVGINNPIPGNQFEVSTSAASAISEVSCWSTNANHDATLRLQKSASATINTLAATAAGEDLGRITARGVDTSSTSVISSQILFEGDAAPDADRVPGRISFWTSDTVSLLERVRIDDNGHTGFRVAPTYPVHIPWLAGDTTTTAYFGSTNASNDQIAIEAYSYSQPAIHGQSSSSYGIYGVSTTSYGVAGVSTSGNGVLAQSNVGTALTATLVGAGTAIANFVDGVVPILTIQDGGQADFAEYIRHLGDTNTYTRFRTDQWTLTCGGVTMIDAVEAGTDYIILGAQVGISIASFENWNTNFIGNVIQISDYATFGAFGNAATYILANAYFDTTNTWKYQRTDGAVTADMDSGVFRLRVAASGTADTAISWSTRIIANTTGIGLNGVTSPSTAFDIGAGAIELDEMTAPGGGAVNTCRLYCVDNGGKTELYAIFNTGIAQLIAAQP